MMKHMVQQTDQNTDMGVERYLLKPEHSLVLAIDIQEQGCSNLDQDTRERLLRNSRMIIKSARMLRIPVIASEQTPGASGPTMAVIDELLDDSMKIAKTAHSCWREGQLRQAIKKTGRHNIVIIGMQAHLCVLQTAMELLHIGYNPVVAMDAVESCLRAHKETALQAMTQAGAVVYPTETIVSMLMEHCITPFNEKGLAQTAANPVLNIAG